MAQMSNSGHLIKKYAVAGSASGAIVCALGYISLSYYKAGKLCKPVTAASLVVAAGLTAVMAKRYRDTGALFPALTFCVTSGAMSLFYVWSLIAGPRPKGKQR